MTLSHFVRRGLVIVSTALAFAPGANARTPWLLPTDEDPLPADTQQQVRKLVNESAAASAKNDWEGAHSALLRAWEIKPLAAIAANLGYVEIKLGRYREAAEHLLFFLNKAPTDRGERRADAEQQLAECRKHVAVVAVSTNIDGAQVTVDGSEIGQSPLPNQLFLDPGMHAVKLTHPGLQPELRTISLEPGTEVALRFKLVAEPVVPIEPGPIGQSASAKPAATERSGIHAKTWVLIGGSAATAISLGVGMVYRIKASSLSSDANSTLAQLDAVSAPSEVASHGECVTPTGIAQSLCEQLHSSLAKKDSATNISTSAFVTAGVLGVATAVTYFLWSVKTSRAKPSAHVQFGLTPWSLGKIQGFVVYTAF